MYQTLIAAVTVGAGGTTSIAFNAIPQTYTDLVLVYSAYNTAAVLFNNDTAGNYSQRVLRGSGTAVTSTSSSSVTFGIQIGLQNSSSDLINSATTIPNYAGSTTKTVSVDMVGERNFSAAFQAIIAGRWTGTAAITSIRIEWSGSTYPQGSTAYLYGTLKGSGGATVTSS